MPEEEKKSYEIAREMYELFLKRVREIGDVSKLFEYSYRTETEQFKIFPLLFSELHGGGKYYDYIVDALFLVEASDVKKIVKGKIYISSWTIWVVLGDLWFEVDNEKLEKHESKSVR